jgi:hypothetical protein
MQAFAHRSNWSADAAEMPGRSPQESNGADVSSDGPACDVLPRPPLAQILSGILSYSDLELTGAGRLSLTIKVSNDSSRYCREVIQVYARPSIPTPSGFERLIGWEALALRPKETFSLSVDFDEGLLLIPETSGSPLLPQPWAIMIRSLNTLRYSKDVHIPIR